MLPIENDRKMYLLSLYNERKSINSYLPICDQIAQQLCLWYGNICYTLWGKNIKSSSQKSAFRKDEHPFEYTLKSQTKHLIKKKN